MVSNFKKVLEFNETFGVTVHSSPQSDIFETDPKLVELRVNLIKEEVQELKDAVSEKDMVETIDALADILYVAYGMGCSFGIDLDNSISELYKKHMKKLNTSYTFEDVATNYQRTMEMNKAIGVPVQTTVQNDIFDTDKSTKIVKLCIDVINTVLIQLTKFVDKKDINGVTESLSYLICSVYRMGCSLGIDLDKAMGMVHDSNMSKLCRTENEAQDTVDWYKSQFEEGKLNYDSASYRVDPKSGKYIVFNASTGKILKNINYNAVNFTAYSN